MQLPSHQSLTSVRQKNGYTLIEVIVVLAIMGIVFTMGFVNFQDYSRQQALQAVVKSLQTELKSAQGNAIAGKKPAACNGVLDGYQFQRTSPTTYQIAAYCSQNIVTLKTITLPADFTLQAPTPNPIKFKTLGQGTNIPAGTTATVTVTQISSGKTRSVSIGENGNVE